MADKAYKAKPKKPLSDLLEKEPDVTRRAALIDFAVDMMRDPEETLLRNASGSTFMEWSEANFMRLVEKAARVTGGDPAEIADKNRRTPEQQQALIEISGREQIDRLTAYLNSNYHNALKHILAYYTATTEAQGIENIYKPLGEEVPCMANQNGELVNVPLAAALYFFATHETIDPREQDALTADDKAAIIESFARLDAFYMEHRAELRTEQELLKAFLDSINPKSPAIARETMEHIALKRAELIEYPLDKVNSGIWNLLERDTAGLILLKAEKAGGKKEINILYSIDFDALGDDVTITKRLLPFDKRVYIAVSALFNAGNSTITLTQIYYAMGYIGRPGSNDLGRINASVAKMRGANIYISNEQEAAVYKYDKFIYKGSLLPFEQVEAIVNGQLVEAAIRLFREPPVITFAKQRKQVTSIDVKLLQSPISKTDANLLIDDYLIERISRAKNGKQSQRILFKTLYEKAGITDASSRSRAPGKIKRYLEHYQKCEMITRFVMETDGVTVYFT